MTNSEFIQRLPEECQGIRILPRHKMSLEHFSCDDRNVWVVLLTEMPGDCSKAWRVPRREYWELEPKHGPRDRYIRENFTPVLVADRNPSKQRIVQKSLFE